MNSLCSCINEVAAKLPVLGLDVAKKSVQAELRTSAHKMRFCFANSTKGFAQLAHILKQHNVPKVWAGLGSHWTLQPCLGTVAAWPGSSGELTESPARQTVRSQCRQSQQNRSAGCRHHR
jgi:hypothetical protein